MPELPEVETTCRGISPHIQGQRVKQVVVRQPRLRWPIPSNIEQLLANSLLLNVTRRGKYILLEFELGTAMIHLGMSGSIRILDERKGETTEVTKHDHFDIVFSGGKTLRYNDPRRFGSFLWAGETPSEHKLLSRLGVEPLEADFTAEHLYKLSRKRKVNIKQFIMDSNIVVGVGNIYANEALFQAGIRPINIANKISLKRYQQLVSKIKQVLTRAIKQGGTTLKDFSQSDGKPGYFAQQLQVYGRAGEACVNCDSLLLEVRQSGRSTVYCKNCQR